MILERPEDLPLLSCRLRQPYSRFFAYDLNAKWDDCRKKDGATMRAWREVWVVYHPDVSAGPEVRAATRNARSGRKIFVQYHPGCGGLDDFVREELGRFTKMKHVPNERSVWEVSDSALNRLETLFEALRVHFDAFSE